MKRISLIIAIMISQLMAVDSDITARLKQIAKSIEAKHPSITDATPRATSHREIENTSRDLEDIVGEWRVESQTADIYITVGTDQTHPNISQTMALEEGEGSIHVYSSFNTDLTYFLDPSIFEDGAVATNRDVYALDYAQNYVDNNAEDQGQDVFDLINEFNLIVDGEDVSGGLGGDNPDNCEINWPTDPYKAAVYSFVSEYVLYEGGSVGCYFDYYSDQSYSYVAEELEDDWTGGGNEDEICLYLEMFDSECDGWNNAHWTLTDEWGDVVETGTLGDGACFGDIEICVEPGYYTFNCIGSGADTDDEISWTLYDSDYETMASGGANDGTSFNLEDTGGGEEGEPYGFIMNMNFMEFFMFMFGEEPLVENPTIVIFGSSTNDENIDMVGAITLIDNEMVEFQADMETTASFTSVDTTNYTITFSDLELMDESEELSMTLSGTFGPEMVDYLAGVETLVEFPIEMFADGSDENTDFYTSFYSDSTGMERIVEFDEESHETWTDTSYFEWMATADSLYLIYEDENNGDVEFVNLEYMIEEDTLFAGGYFYPCGEDYDSYEDCLEDADMFFLSEFTDIEDFRFYSQRTASWVGTVSTEADNNLISESFALYPNFPNPFNPTTTIRFNVAESHQDVTLRIFDLSGRMVETLLNEKLKPGQYNIRWNGGNTPSGVYILHAENGTTSHTQKMVLIK